MTMQTHETNKYAVVKVSDDGATVAANGENTLIAWDVLSIAAKQEDIELRQLYGALLSDARRMVRDNKRVTVRVGVNYDPSGRSSSYAIDASGQDRRPEFRPMDADGQGSLPECNQTADDIYRAARSRGYFVRREPTTLPDGSIASRCFQR